ncbi:response regulator [Deinococcus hopiensis]|uniref:response regulator n=1 Tax=Deinococcus hopiensis TaxID=309885 RepID=UPI001FE64142|nr:response regulator [Deinococcus hopiensis]
MLDINMPGMNGLEVLKALKSDRRLAYLPVVMLSSSSNEDDVQAAYALHANAYLMKPHRFEEFVEQMAAFVHYWEQNRRAHFGLSTRRHDPSALYKLPF